MTTARDVALDLLNKGGVSIPMLGGELVKRRLLSNTHTVADAYAEARDALNGLASEGKAQRWPDGYVFTLPASTPMEPRKESK